MTTYWSRERLVNTTTAGTQTDATVTALANGGTVVAWADVGPAIDVIRFQRYDTFGNPVGAETTVATPATSASSPTVVALQSGGFAIGMMTSSSTISLQRYDASGNPTGSLATVASDGLGSLVTPFDMVEASAGEIALVYTRVVAGERDVIMRIVSSSNAVGPDIVVDALAGTEQSTTSIARGGARLAVTWTDLSVTGGDIQARAFNLNGTTVGGEVTVNASTANSQFFNEVAALPDGFVAIWRDGFVLRGQMLESNMNLRGPEFVVAFDLNGNETFAVTGLPDGNFFVVYGATGTQLFAQHMTSTGAVAGPRLTLDTNIVTNEIEISALPDGRIVVAWEGTTDVDGRDPLGPGIYTRIIDPRSSGSTVTGTANGENLLGNDLANDWIVGFDGSDSLSGLGGNDVLEGDRGVDVLRGGEGDDLIYGGSSVDFVFGENGDDFVQGDEGSDSVDGGAGFDTGVFASTRSSYTLARPFNGIVQVTGAGVAATDGIDSLSAVERLRFANVTMSVTPSFDFTGDFASDVVLRNVNTNEISFWDLENAAFASSTQLGTLAATTAIADAGDFNRDGSSDLLLRDASTGAISVLPIVFNVPQPVFQIGGVGANIEVVGAADFNADTFSEILLRDRTTGAVTFWALNPDGGFGASVSLGGVLANIEVIGTGDFFGDGDSDVLLRNLSTGAVSVWQIEDNAFVSSNTIGGVGANFTVVGAFDFTGDAIADILLHDRSTGGISYWRTDANGQFVASVEIGGITANTSIVDARDINGDGFADVLLRDSIDGSIDAFTVVDGVFSAFVTLGGAGTDFVFV